MDFAPKCVQVYHEMRLIVADCISFSSSFFHRLPPVLSDLPSRAHLHEVGMLRCLLSTQTNRSVGGLAVRARPLFLFCLCVYFCLYGPFTCILFHKFSRQLSAFSLRSSGLISALLVLSTTCLFMKVSLSPDVILCDCLGVMHQLTK